MKKLMLLFLLVGAFTVKADIEFDDTTGKFYSTPKSTNIDQDEYDSLFKLALIHILHQKSLGISEEEAFKEIVKRLKTIGTPTALRLLEDMVKKGTELLAK